MRLLRGVTLATNRKGERRFVSREPSTAARPETAARVDPTSSVGLNYSEQTYRAEPSSTKSVKEPPRVVQRDVRPAETASMGDGGATPQGTSVTDVVVHNMLGDVLAGVIARHDPTRPNRQINDLYRDIYYNDATCGSAVVLRSTLPFSEFSLSGLRDERMLDVFVSSVESMNMQSLLPQLSTDYDVLGAFLGSMAWNESEKRYTGISPHNLDFAHFEQIPAFGVDPRVSIVLPEGLSKTLQSEGFKQRYGNMIPDDVTKAVNKETPAQPNENLNGFPLTPEHTIFISRGGMLRDFTGMSYFRRVLPAWLYEKALIMGTHDQVYKRQRGTMHITVENTEDWVADQDEMNTIAGLFMSADLDPMGAVVVTRGGVGVNEVRRGDDFWRWDANFDMIERIKLRALGISESFVTGDANFSTMEQTLSVFMEQIRDYRARITQEVFYQKMFPMIAHKNNITKRRYGQRRGEFASYGETVIGYDRHGDLFATVGSCYPRTGIETAQGIHNFNPSDYVIPKVQWHKRLMPEADTEYIGMLAQMQELGLPINIRGLAAAGGFNIDDVVNGIDEDLRIRQKIGEWRKELAQIDQQVNPEGTNPDMEMARVSDFLARAELGVGGVRPKTLGSYANTDAPESEFIERDSQGRRRVLTAQGRQVIANRFNRRMGEVAAEVARQENARTRAEHVEPARKIYTGN